MVYNKLITPSSPISRLALLQLLVMAASSNTALYSVFRRLASVIIHSVGYPDLRTCSKPRLVRKRPCPTLSTAAITSVIPPPAIQITQLTKIRN